MKLGVSQGLYRAILGQQLHPSWPSCPTSRAPHRGECLHFCTVDAMAWMVAPTLTLSRQREEVGPRPIVKKQAVMAGSGWEAAAVAASWTSSSVVSLVHRQWLDIPVLCAETGTHSANCAADRRVSSGAALLLCNVVHSPRVQGRRHLCRGADADPLGPSVHKIIEFLQLQYIDKVIDVWFAGPAVFGAVVEETAELPQLRRFAQTLTGVAMPVVVQRQMPGGSDSRKLRRSRSCSTF